MKKGNYPLKLNVLMRINLIYFINLNLIQFQTMND